MKRLFFLLSALWLLVFQMAAVSSAGYDVNSDGEINIGDINAVVNLIIDEADEPTADVNGDREVNIADVNTLVDVLLSDGHYRETLEFRVGDVPFTMVKVDGGTFVMGNNSGRSNEKPEHQVTLSTYYIGETEVAQALWKAAGCINRSYYKGNKLPVNDVIWLECQEFIRRLNVLTGYRFSLPTEAQWEFAARGGNESKGYLYAGGDDIGAVAWYHDNSNIDGKWIHEVAAKQPNELGLYDMSGNVEEWCLDSFKAYRSGAQVDPVWPGVEDDYDDCTIRGGSCVTAATQCRVTAREWCSTQLQEGDNGMRLALQDSEPVALGVSEDDVEIFEGDVTAVTITGGKGDYRIHSSDEEIATVTISGSVMYIQGVGTGTTTIAIDDEASGLQARVLVRVGMKCDVAGVTFKMMPVEGGTFLMGDTWEQALSYGDGDGPHTVHEVTLSNYCIGQTEVTQELWTAVMGYNPSQHDEWQNFINPQGPVENMTWDECMEFISRLNELTGLHFRLPTEAEWEFAARGGNRSRHYRYSGSRYIKEVGWYESNADHWQGGGLYGPQTVALLLPNELGLYDMSGNVWEYCQDWYGPYSAEPQTNPTGPSTGTARIMRGGSFIEGDTECSCAKRGYTKWYDEGGNTKGFRLAL